MKIEKLINDEYVRVASAEKNKEYSKQKDEKKVENTLYENTRYKLYIKKHGVVELIESAKIIGDNIDKKV
jgi:hypothetical protein